MSLNVDNLAKAITKVGQILLESGAEIHRVEDTMERIAKAYGVQVVDSYATPSMLIISFTLDDHLVHNIKRVKTSNVDLAKIDKINYLSREICLNPIDVETLDQKLDEINQSSNIEISKLILGAAICTFGFAIYFEGSIIDALIAMLIGVVVKLFANYLERYFPSSFFVHIFASALLTFLAIVFSNIISCNRNIVIISSLMLLVPGLAITNAIRDSVGGDLLSGLTKATEAVFIAVALAIGSGVVTILMGVL